MSTQRDFESELKYLRIMYNNTEAELNRSRTEARRLRTILNDLEALLNSTWRELE